MTQRINGIQNVVLKLVRYNGEMKRKEILSEMSNLFGRSDDKLKSQVDQALYCLKKKGYLSRNDGTWHSEEVYERSHISFVCSALTTKDGRNNYCPVREVFIGDPKAQCGVIFDFDYTELRQKIIPRRECYFVHKPSALEIEHMKKVIENNLS